MDEYKMPDGQIRFNCPCCRFPTLDERCTWEICLLCWWEDDGQDDPFADEVWGGPNYHLSLTEGRRNFYKFYQKFDLGSKDKFTTRTVRQRRIVIELVELYRMLVIHFVSSEKIKIWERIKYLEKIYHKKD